MIINNNLPQAPTQSKNLFQYVIIDCAHFDHTFYRNLRKEPNLLYRSLFINTPDERSIIASPVLIQLDLEKNASFIQKLQEIEKEQRAVVWLWSKKEFNPLFQILQPLLYGELESGEKILCRYYDPRCLEGFVEMFKKDSELANSISEIKHWAYLDTNNQYVYL